MDGAAAQQPAADCSATARSRGHTAESFSVTATPLDADLEYEKHWNELLFARFPKLKECKSPFRARRLTVVGRR